MLSGFDERGQAIQVGAVLLFGILIVAFAGYQAFVVPTENKQIEFRHSQTVKGDLQEVRNAIVSVSRSRAGSVAVSLGTQYPTRALFLNPGPPSGSLRTVGTGNESLNLTVRNATGSGEPGDFWNGSTHRYDTGGLVYRPNYNEFQGAPATVYENTVLFDQYREGNVTLTGQRLVDGETVTLVALNGSVGETQNGRYTVEVQPASVSETRVGVSNTSHTVTVGFPSRLGVGAWRNLLDGEFTGQGGHVERVEATPLGGGVSYVAVHLEPGVEYDLRLLKVGVGTGVTGTDPGYVLPVEGNGSTIPEGATTRVVVEVRDRYNNPASGRLVNASASLPGGSVTPTQARTDGDGRIVLEYDAPDDVSGVAQRTEQLNVSYAVDAPYLNDSAFDPETRSNATVRLRVTNADGSGLGTGGSGGSAYDIDWTDPSGQTGVSCSPDVNGVCSINGSKTPSVDLTGVTSPTADGASVQFAVSDTTVGTVSPTTETTNAAGEATTTFALNDNGTAKVYVSSGGGGDVLDVEVTDFKSSTDTTDPTIDSFTVTDKSVTTGGNKRARFEVDWSVSDNTDLSSLSITLTETATGTQVDSATPSVSGTSASGTNTLEDAGGNPKNTEYRIELTVADSAGNTNSTSDTQFGDGSDNS